MSAVFLKILNMSITASWMILAVVLLRLFLKKAPKWVNCLMWALVGVRLVCPFSFKSVTSLIPSAQTVPADIAAAESPGVNTGIGAVNEAVNPVLTSAFGTTGTGTNPMQAALTAAAAVWLAGIAAMLVYAAVSFWKMKRTVRPFYSVLNKNKIKTKYGIKNRHWREALQECIKNMENM